MITISARPAPPPELRADYLHQLPEPQELFVENLVSDGLSWSIHRDDQEIGYGVTNGGDMLVELHLIPQELRHLNEAFDRLAALCGIRRILAKSFDPTPLFVAYARRCEAKTIGLLYRVIADRRFEEDAAIHARAATNEDVASLLDIGSDFFDGPADIEGYIGSDGLIVYESRRGARLGAGVLKRVTPNQDDIDIGMVVAPRRRRSGFGAYIVAHLKARCLAQGLRPICGCSIDNVASQRTLERAGFASRHRLIEFQL